MACWTLAGSGVLVLLVAAINIKNQKNCKSIAIEISGVRKLYFLNKQDVLNIVTGEVAMPEEKSIRSFNLQRLENRLEQNIYVKDAELFFDNNLVLHIAIEEREPVARIFTTSNQSFYIDGSGTHLPLRDNMIVRLPVFTGCPAAGKQSVQRDSLLMNEITTISQYLLRNNFWMAQIAQVDVVGDKGFEMVPTLGNHIIQFGNASNCEDKFKRLHIFYKQVLSKTGLDRYSRINVAYSKQVIGIRKEGITKIDSVQAVNNIRKMVEEATKKPDDSLYVPVVGNEPGTGIERENVTAQKNAAATQQPKALMKKNK